MPRHVADQCSNPPERELGASGVAGRLLVAADVAQLVEHHLAKVRVAGSNPVVRSKCSMPGRSAGHRTFSGTSRFGRGRKVASRCIWIKAMPLVALLAACGSAADPQVETPEPSTTQTSVVVTSPIDVTRLPIGTNQVSLDRATVGGLFACDAGNPNGGGAHASGPWIDEAAGTWDLTKKVSVQGEVSWPMASYSERIDGEWRIIDSKGLPVEGVTGVFPISPDDPAFAFDRNPNSIAVSDREIVLPLYPAPVVEPSCLGKGAVGILKNGVVLFAPIDEQNRDAVAYETQDQCDGHPQQTSLYHYHDVPSCILNAATGSSTVVGFAFDGFPIVVERDANGDLVTNADLDECHGRVSEIDLDGQTASTYHYSATREFPYIIGCFRGAPIS